MGFPAGLDSPGYNVCMPIFEYRCTDCEREFEAFVTAERTAECPACQGANLVKLLSSPGMVRGTDGGSRAQASLPMAGGCGAGGAHCACRGES
jgi:putative FmdB family regulatory protein